MLLHAFPHRHSFFKLGGVKDFVLALIRIDLLLLLRELLLHAFPHRHSYFHLLYGCLVFDDPLLNLHLLSFPGRPTRPTHVVVAVVVAVEVLGVLRHDLQAEVALELDLGGGVELVEHALGDAAVLEQEVAFGAARALHAKVEVACGCAPGKGGHLELGGALVALPMLLGFWHQGEVVPLFTGQGLRVCYWLARLH